GIVRERFRVAESHLKGLSSLRDQPGPKSPERIWHTTVADEDGRRPQIPTVALDQAFFESVPEIEDFLGTELGECRPVAPVAFADVHVLRAGRWTQAGAIDDEPKAIFVHDENT